MTKWNSNSKTKLIIKLVLTNSFWNLTLKGNTSKYSSGLLISYERLIKWKSFNDAIEKKEKKKREERKEKNRKIKKNRISYESIRLQGQSKMRT